MEFEFCKLEIFLPESHLEAVQQALWSVDAGHIGAYDRCLSRSRVESCWRPLEGTDPFLGMPGELCRAEEWKVEVCCREDRLAETLAAVRAAHPYEEPVINVIPLAATGLEEKKQGWTPAASRTRSKIAMENNKNILIINDMPGYGKVATAAMLPILSNMGHSVYNLPTALVSNTLDYGTFSILDTTDYMVQAIAAWKKLGFSFDCITTGFLASAEQVDIIREFIASQKKEGLLVMTDPIMGDDGKLYNGVTEETVENMRRLLGVADVIVPNLTEAEFLTGKYQGRESLTAGEARELVDGLLTFGPRSVVVTSGVEEETGRHVVWGYNRETGAHFTIPYQFIQVHFPGTGDMFSAVLVGELLAGRGLEPAVRRAMDVLETLIRLERDEAEKNKGIRIEKYLSVLNQ